MHSGLAENFRRLCENEDWRFRDDNIQKRTFVHMLAMRALSFHSLPGINCFTGAQLGAGF